MKRRMIALILLFSLLLTGCGGKGAQTQTDIKNDVHAAADSGDVSEKETASTDVSGTDTAIEVSDMFTERDYKVDYKEEESAVIKLENTTASCDSDAVQVSDGTVTITEEGTYILSGTLDDGMVIINADKTDKVQLVLDNADIRSETSAAIYVSQADKVFITMADESKNTVSNGGKFTAIDDNNIDAAIFSKDDMTLNGSGSLTVNSPAGHGIVSKDDLVITGGTYHITSGSHGLSGKESVRIAEGNVEINSEEDGIHSDNADDASLGFFYAVGGTYQITAKGDGISATGSLQIDGGTYSVTTGGGSAGAVKEWKEGWESFADSNASDSSEDKTSEKGMKASGNLTINGGTFSIDSSDDAIHSNSSLTVNGGAFQISTGDDGFHADNVLTITDGEIGISQSYEGIEGLKIEISGGNITLVASDDGLNAAGGNDNSGEEGFRGKDAFDSNPDCSINISGGILKIDASGDGIDSNGSINISGGETYVSGPTNGGNGALDYGTEATATGGVLVAAGAADMAEAFGSASTQGAIFVSFERQSAGSTVELADSSGTAILSWEAGKEYESVVITCPRIVQGETYTLTAGSYSTQITMESIVYGSGSGMGRPGKNPDTGNPPADARTEQPEGNPPTAPGTERPGKNPGAGRPGKNPDTGNLPTAPEDGQSGNVPDTGNLPTAPGTEQSETI